MATILVVDDNTEMSDLVRMYLAADGHSVETAKDGIEAMKIAPDLLPELIISDILMPGMDGFGLFEAVRAHPKMATVPVVFLTGSNDRETLLRALRVGVDDFLSKPFDRAELVSVVSNRLRPSAGTDAAADPWHLKAKETPARSPSKRAPVSEFIPKPKRIQVPDADDPDNADSTAHSESTAPPPESLSSPVPMEPEGPEQGAEPQVPEAVEADPGLEGLSISDEPEVLGEPEIQDEVKGSPLPPAAGKSAALPPKVRIRHGAPRGIQIADDSAPIRFSLSDTKLADISLAVDKRKASATLLFCDVRGFQAFRQGLSGLEVVEILTQFFLSSRNTVKKQGGWMVKFLGDGFAAVFEDSDEAPDSQQVRALKAALMIVLAAQRLKAWLRTRFPDREFPEFAVGIGLHSGLISVGTMPESSVERHTVSGDPVVLCARLEQLTKEYGWSIIASQATFLNAAEILSLGRGSMAPGVNKNDTLLVAEVRGPLADAASSQEQLKVFALIEAAVESNTAAIVALGEQESED